MEYVIRGGETKYLSTPVLIKQHRWLSSLSSLLSSHRWCSWQQVPYQVQAYKTFRVLQWRHLHPLLGLVLTWPPPSLGRQVSAVIVVSCSIPGWRYKSCGCSRVWCWLTFFPQSCTAKYLSRVHLHPKCLPCWGWCIVSKQAYDPTRQRGI